MNICLFFLLVFWLILFHRTLLKFSEKNKTIYSLTVALFHSIHKKGTSSSFCIKLHFIRISFQRIPYFSPLTVYINILALSSNINCWKCLLLKKIYWPDRNILIPGTRQCLYCLQAQYDIQLRQYLFFVLKTILPKCYLSRTLNKRRPFMKAGNKEEEKEYHYYGNSKKRFHFFLREHKDFILKNNVNHSKTYVSNKITNTPSYLHLWLCWVLIVILIISLLQLFITFLTLDARTIKSSLGSKWKRIFDVCE